MANKILIAANATPIVWAAAGKIYLEANDNG